MAGKTSKGSVKEKDELEEWKKLMELQAEKEREKHDLKMEELKYKRESDRLHHEREKERQRIKMAEIRKNHELKQKFRRF